MWPRRGPDSPAIALPSVPPSARTARVSKSILESAAMNAEELGRFVRGVFLIVSASAGIGVLAMALVQLIKDLTPARYYWQKRWIERWIARQAADSALPPEGRRAFLATQSGEKLRPPDPRAALNDLIVLATAGDTKALFDLPLDQFAGQVNAASQAVVEFPRRHPDLLPVLAVGAESDDLNLLLHEEPPKAVTPALAARMAKIEPAAEAEDPMAMQARMSRFIDARNRVAHQVQRNLDALQIAMGFRWKLWLQALAILVSYAMVALFAAAIMPEAVKVGAGPLLLVGLIGGFFASIFRDLLATLIDGRRSA